MNRITGEQRDPVLRNGPEVPLEPRRDSGRLRVGYAPQHGRSIDEPATTVLALLGGPSCEAGTRVVARFGRDPLQRPQQIPRVGVGDEFLVRDGVPGVERGKPCQQTHRAPVRAHRVVGALPAGVLVRPCLPAREHQRGGEPLEVPLPRAEHGLVEVVEVDDQIAARVSVQTEVGRVRVAAELRAHACDRRTRQVMCHQAGRTAQKGEGRCRHAPHPYGRQAGHPALVRLLDRLHRVRPSGRQHERPVIGPGNLEPQRLARRFGGHRFRGHHPRPGRPHPADRTSRETPDERDALVPRHPLHRHRRFDLVHGARLPRTCPAVRPININRGRRYSRAATTVLPCGQLPIPSVDNVAAGCALTQRRR